MHVRHVHIMNSVVLRIGVLVIGITFRSDLSSHRRKGVAMRVGDIIVNPWVDSDFKGELNPMYATIYLGNNESLDYKGRKHKWADKVYKNNPDKQTPWKVIGYIDLKRSIEFAILADTLIEEGYLKIEELEEQLGEDDAD